MRCPRGSACVSSAGSLLFSLSAGSPAPLPGVRSGCPSILLPLFRAVNLAPPPRQASFPSFLFRSSSMACIGLCLGGSHSLKSSPIWLRRPIDYPSLLLSSASCSSDQSVSTCATKRAAVHTCGVMPMPELTCKLGVALVTRVARPHQRESPASPTRTSPGRRGGCCRASFPPHQNRCWAAGHGPTRSGAARSLSTRAPCGKRPGAAELDEAVSRAFGQASSPARCNPRLPHRHPRADCPCGWQSTSTFRPNAPASPFPKSRQGSSAAF